MNAYLLDLWRRESIVNRFTTYDPGEVAARFLLPLLVEECGYPRNRFFNPSEVERVALESGGSGYENYTLREEQWRAFNSCEPMELREGLYLVVLRPALIPEEYTREMKRAESLSQRNPDATVLATSFDRMDVLMGGRVVRQYGLRDWERRFDELRSLLHFTNAAPPGPLGFLEEERRFADIVVEAYQPIVAAFEAAEIRRVLHRNPKKENHQVAAVQALAYFLFLRATEEAYPFERNYLRRIHWAYSGDGREAYGDVGLAGVVWADLNRIIRGMGEGEIMHTYLGYTFPDRALRHKLWSMNQCIDNEAIQPALESIVTERFGLLRAIHFGPLLGRLLARARTQDGANGLAPGDSALSLQTDGEERKVTTGELRAFLDKALDERFQPAFEADDVARMREASEWAMRLRITERHTDGPIAIAQAAESLTEFYLAIERMQEELRARMQQTHGGFMFVEEEVGSFGPMLKLGREESSGGPYWSLFETRILSGSYATEEGAEIAELAINMLNVLHANRAARFPRSVEAMQLRGYARQWLVVGDDTRNDVVTTWAK